MVSQLDSKRASERVNTVKNWMQLHLAHTPQTRRERYIHTHIHLQIFSLSANAMKRQAYTEMKRERQLKREPRHFQSANKFVK